MIAAPRFVGGEMVKPDPGGSDAVLREQFAHPGFHVRVPDIDIHGFDPRELLDELCVHGRHAGVAVGETDSVGPRPGKPGSGVRFPFRGHVKAQLRWSGCGRHGQALKATVVRGPPPSGDTIRRVSVRFPWR